MKDTIHQYASFALALMCACMGLLLAYEGQTFLFAGRWLQDQADWLQAAALRIAGLDGIEDERAGRI